MDPWALLYIITVALIWGLTNPLMKKCSKGIETCASEGTSSSSWISSLFLELKFLFTNWQYCLAYLLNQCGSLLYYYTLGQVDLSIASPLTNTLTFIVTYLAGILLFGEKDEESNIEKKIGLTFVCSGVLLIMIDKL